MRRKALHIEILLTFMVTAWFIGLFSNSLFPLTLPGSLPGLFPDKLYSLVCHRDAAKSFFINGIQLEVCARCTGIYTGAVLFSIVALSFKSLRPYNKMWLLYSMIPMAFDVILYMSGIYHYSKWIAFSTGFILGSVSILYIFTGIEEYFHEFKLSSNAH